MSHSVGKLTNSFHLLSLTELLVDSTALGHVARDLSKPDQDAGIVVDGVDDHIRPEPRAVLAYAPTLRLESSVPNGNRQCAVWQPVFLILRCVNTGKMLTNNLLCPIAFDPLGAGVPIGDDASGIQHENGAIRYSLDEKSEAAFALTKLRQHLRQLSGTCFHALLERFIELSLCLLALFAGGKINQHVHCPDELSRSIMERRRISHERHAHSVRPLGDGLPAPDRPVFLQGPRHRALIVRHRPAIRPIQAPRNAPLIAAYFGDATGKLYCSLV